MPSATMPPAMPWYETRVNTTTAIRPVALLPSPTLGRRLRRDLGVAGPGWISRHGIYAQRYNADGNAVGSETLVNSTKYLDQEHPATAGLSDGGFVVTWITQREDGSGLDVYGRTSQRTLRRSWHTQSLTSRYPEDHAWSFQVPTNAFADVDGDTLTYSASQGDGSALPYWIAFKAATRTFSGTPPANFNDAVDLKVTASDGFVSASDTFKLTITPS